MVLELTHHNALLRLYLGTHFSQCVVPILVVPVTYDVIERTHGCLEETANFIRLLFDRLFAGDNPGSWNIQTNFRHHEKVGRPGATEDSV